MDEYDEQWFAMWIEGLSKNAVTLEARGDAVVVLHNDLMLVSAEQHRAIPHV
jgi:hypothetical protein